MLIALLAGIAVMLIAVSMSDRRPEHRLISMGAALSKPGGEGDANPAGVQSGSGLQNLLRRWFPSVFAPEQIAANDEDAVVAIIDRAVQLLRSGVVPSRVMSMLADAATGPLAQVLSRIARIVEMGQSPHTAIVGALGEVGTRQQEVLRGMAAVWMVAETSGAPAAEMLERYAQTCREKSESQRERDVALAGPLSTVKVLSILPLISLVLAALIGADYTQLIAQPVGCASLVGGVMLLLGGRLWMRLMLRRAL